MCEEGEGNDCSGCAQAGGGGHEESQPEARGQGKKVAMSELRRVSPVEENWTRRMGNPDGKARKRPGL